MFDNTNPYTIRIEETNGQKRYFVAFIDGQGKDSIILLEQIRTIDKQRLQEYLGTLDGRFLVAVDKALAISVALERGGKSA